MKTLYYFYVKLLLVDNIETNASGEVMANSYTEAVDRIYKYHSNLYGKILSIYIEEKPQNTAIAAEIPPLGGNFYGYASIQ